MRVVVTGGAGFIGRVVVRMLRERGDHVLVIDSMLSQVHGDIGLHATSDTVRAVSGADEGWMASVRQAAALRDPNVWAVDAVIHLAAEVGVGQSQYEPARYVQANALETALLWECNEAYRKSIKSVVAASSMSL